MKTRPRLLDLFSGAGGSAVGYDSAGFDVYGVDIIKRKRYPFAFHHGDALDVLRRLVAGEAVPFIHPDNSVEWMSLSDFDAVHASPPCQLYSQSTVPARQSGIEYPDLMEPTRAALTALPLPWIIENVPGAPMRADYSLCGCMFGLKVLRLRHFETSWGGFSMMPSHNHDYEFLTIIGDSSPPSEVRRNGRVASQEERRAAMGCDWMRGDELGLAIPPAYTEWLGAILLDQIPAGVKVP